MAGPDPMLVNTGSYTLPTYTFATLPTAASMVGREAYITDGAASRQVAFSQTAAGGGTFFSRVRSNGTAWKVA